MASKGADGLGSQSRADANLMSYSNDMSITPVAEHLWVSPSSKTTRRQVVENSGPTLSADLRQSAETTS